MAAKKKKREYRFTKKMREKLLVMFFIVISCLIGLVIRIVLTQQNDGERYKKIVLSQQRYNSETIPFRRGDILDSKGTILATSEDVYNVIIDCKLILENKDYIEPTITAILQCFKDVTEEELRTLLKEKSESHYYKLRKKLSAEEIQVFKDLQNKVYTEGKYKGEKENPDVQGVTFEKEYIRRYPYDTLACKVLGFTTSGNVGIGGLEDYYNTTLNGINGRKYGYLNSEDNVEKTIKDAINGSSLLTTLDLNVQNIVEQKIAEFNEEHRDEAMEGPGSKNTAVLVMNPNNGEIIAMADSTGYSLNQPWDEKILSDYCINYQGYTESDVEKLLKEENEEQKLDMLNALWQNYCITYTFEPGSTVKPLTVATGLEIGTIFNEDVYYCDGSEKVGPHRINCVNVNGHGMETLEQTIMNSCNDALMQIAFKIGVDEFTKYQNIFNIGLRTNIDLPGEARTDSLIYTAENMAAASLATNAFGQNYNTTMVQVASAFASVINGGYYYQPHLVKKIIDENGDTVRHEEGTVLKQTISQQTSDLVRQYLVSTVAAGTAKSAKVPGYSMGGKTGTAEKQPRGDKRFLVSFIGFAPAENPEVLVYVVIDEPNLENQAQSTYATNLAREIMAEIFPYLNIFPDEPIDESEMKKEDEMTSETAVENTGADEIATENTGAGETATENTGADEIATENTGAGEIATENAGAGEIATENTGAGETATENTGVDETATENTGTSGNSDNQEDETLSDNQQSELDSSESGETITGRQAETVEENHQGNIFE